MQNAQEIKITELNPHLICVLCGGYLIDAATIVHCLHSFCRSCIVQYFHNNQHCPICQVLVHKKYPLAHLRSDDILQNVVYKIVPGLFSDEMKRRRDYYQTESKEATDLDNVCSETEGTRRIFCPDEMISLSLEMCCSNEDKNENDELRVVRYLLCPAAVTIGHLKKFMKIKFSLSDTYRIDVFYADEILCDSYSLVDVAYISAWKRKDVLKLNYAVYENPAKRIKLTPSCDLDVNGNDDSGIEDGNTSLDSTNNTSLDTTNNTSLDTTNNTSIDTTNNASLDSINNTNTSFNDSCVSDELSSSFEPNKSLPQNEDIVSTSDSSTEVPVESDVVMEDHCKIPEDSKCNSCNDDISEDKTEDVPNEHEHCEYNYIMDQPGDLVIDESVTSGDQHLDSTAEVPKFSSANDSKDDDVFLEDNHVTSTSASEKLDKHVCDFGTQTSPYSNHMADQTNEINHNCNNDIDGHYKGNENHMTFRIKDKCTGVCNGHEIKPRDNKLVVKFSKERNSESYFIS